LLLLPLNVVPKNDKGQNSLALVVLGGAAVLGLPNFAANYR
jgi:hypothetical protein